jgi:hypothetical protein
MCLLSLGFEVELVRRAPQETCGATWIVIAGNKDIRQWAGEHQLLKDLQHVMRTYPRHEELQKQLCCCLLHIVSHELDNKRQAGELGLLEDIKTMLETLDDVEILVMGCNIAGHICHHCRENKDLAKRCGLLELTQGLCNHDRTNLSKAAKLASSHMSLYDCMPSLEDITVKRSDIPKLDVPHGAAAAMLSGRRRRDVSWRRAITQVTVVNTLKRMSSIVHKSVAEEDTGAEGQATSHPEES